MTQYAALDVSQETTAICLVDEAGRVIGEAKLPTCPDAIAAWLGKKAPDLVRVGLETGPLAVWLWNELHARGAAGHLPRCAACPCSPQGAAEQDRSQ